MGDEETIRRAVAVHRALAAAAIPHALGGAFALGFYAEPRPTTDLDVNVFIPGGEWRRVLAALAPPRLAGGGPLHFFFSHDALHEAMPAAVREVRVEVEDDSGGSAGDGERASARTATLPLVSPEHLVVRKLLLGRDKDRRDVEAIAARTPLDLAEIERWLQPPRTR